MKKFLISVGIAAIMLMSGVNGGNAMDLDNGVCIDSMTKAKNVVEVNSSTFTSFAEEEDGEEMSFVISPGTKIYRGIDIIEGLEFSSLWAITKKSDGTEECYVQTEFPDEIAAIE